MRNRNKMIHSAIPFEFLSGRVFGGVIISLQRSTLKSDKLLLVSVLVITISRKQSCVTLASNVLDISNLFNPLTPHIKIQILPSWPREKKYWGKLIAKIS